MNNSVHWKYQVVVVRPSFSGDKTDPLQVELDTQGARGWELVQAIKGTTGFLDTKAVLRLIFKRPG